jgi:hypothetical protein
VSIINGNISPRDILFLAVLAFVGGFIGFFVSWPYGTRIGILAAPAGLVALSVRGGDMGKLMQLNDSLARREQFYSTFCWEPVIWLVIIAAGCLGVLLGYMIFHSQPAKCAACLTAADVKPEKDRTRRTGAYVYLMPIAAVIGSAFVSMVFIGMLARDFVILDVKVGSAIGQPSLAQIIFAILVSFGISGFLVKKFLGLDYFWPIVSTSLVIPFGIISYGRYEVLEYFVERWPAMFFSHSIMTVLPIQAVAFGTIGTVCGYWTAVRYDYWRQHDSKSE